MSTIHTMQAWHSATTGDAKLGLLALAETVGTDDLTGKVTFNFSSLKAIQRLTLWPEDRVDEFARVALRLPPDYPMGGASGITFDFSEAVDAISGVVRSAV
jgi:hypothetical protein